MTSFHLPTEDGELIHAWHVLPLPVYRQHEEILQAQPTGHCADVTTSESLRILRDDPSAKLIVYCKSYVSWKMSSICRATNTENTSHT